MRFMGGKRLSPLDYLAQPRTTLAASRVWVKLGQTVLAWGPDLIKCPE